MNNGKPEFQFGVHLDMNDRLQSDHRYPSPKGHVKNRRTQARQERNRSRAAAHQAAKIAAASAATTPGLPLISTVPVNSAPTPEALAASVGIFP